MARVAKTTTTNGAAAYTNTGNKLVDLFGAIGASRNNLEGIRSTFKAAFQADPLKATAILLYARDIRHNGAGERAVFRTLLKDLFTGAAGSYMYVDRAMNLIPEIGRFDDLKAAYDTDYQKDAVKIWAEAIKSGNVLAAKWAKREDKVLQRALGVNEASLRKLLVTLRSQHIVEDKMCKGNWSAIDYSRLPSVAGARYAKAFRRNDGTRYDAFINSKDTKVNASTLFPYDVYRMFRGSCRDEEVQKFWDNLADLELAGNIMGMVDVSGSMWWPEARMTNDLFAGDIGISLGVYCANKIEGKFKNTLMTFASRPGFVQLDGTKVVDDFRKVERMEVGGSTNIEAAYEAILQKAKAVGATQSDMPNFLLIFSDMQFNYCTDRPNETIFQNMKKKFEAAGYELPKVVFWCMNASYGNKPVTAFESNVAMVSGFSAGVLKAVLSAKTVTPIAVMEEAIAPFIEMLQK